MRNVFVGSLGALAVGLVLLVGGCSSPPGDQQPSPGASAGGSGTPDFDGDGTADLVAGIGESPSRVTIVYGNDRTQDLRRSELDATESASFGQALLARDLDADGFTDLVVGDPGPLVAAAVFVVPGSASGLDPSRASTLTAPAGLAAFGQALAVVEQPERLLAVGAPGDGAADAPAGSVGGAVALWTLDSSGRPSGGPRILTQESPGAPGDSFGASLASTGGWLAIGAPRRDAEGARDSGSVVLRDLAASPERVWTLTQGVDDVPGQAQAEDRFGFALAAAADHLAVAAPFDDEDVRDAGLVQPFRLTPQGPVAENPMLPSGVGVTEPAGGLFGASLATARPCAGVDGLMIGAPGTLVGDANAAGSAWLVPFAGSTECPPIGLAEGAALGGTPTEMASLGRAVSAFWAPGGGPDTVVLAAPGNAEEAIPGRVLTIAAPFTAPAPPALDGVRLAEEGVLTLSPTG